MSLEYFTNADGTRTIFTPRSKAGDLYQKRYLVQKLTPDGVWAASLRTDDGTEAINQAEALSILGHHARIIDNFF